MRTLIFCYALASSLFAQPPAAPSPAIEPGIPVTDPLVIAKCSGCHRKDDKGNLSRISWERAAPESWQQAIKRMVRLHGVVLSPEEARKIVQYLSDDHGLAPEEAKPAVYFLEKRHLDQEKFPEVVRDACTGCHPYGQAMNWRRAANDWDLLVNMHIGYFPVVEWNSFRGMGNRGGGPPPPPGTDLRAPVEKAIEQIKKDLPLHTKEWADWTATRRQAKLSGKWLISAYQPGKGRYTGEMLVQPGASPNDWATKIELRHITTGELLTREGKGVLYSSYSWRGRSETSASTAVKSMREVMLLSRDQSSMEGRWFWGAYDELGFDVKMQREEDRPQIISTNVSAIRAGKSGKILIAGDKFPENLTPADVDLGAGVSVTAVNRLSASKLEVEVSVAAKAIPGPRDIAVKRIVAPAAVVVYDTVDYVKVSTDTAIARLGGTTHPKGYAQFVAIAYHRGLDGKPNTADDISLGPVQVNWSMEEYYAIYGDDDTQYVGQLNDSGLFTPALEGPNPKRKFSRNNYGDVWIAATYRGDDAATTKDGKPLTAKCYLIVTVPQYMRWDQPEVAQ